MKRRELRRAPGFSLLEIVVAVAILAVIGGPVIFNMVMAKRTVYSSAHDVRAVVVAGTALETLSSIHYPRLPVVDPAVSSDLDGLDRGVAKGRWDVAFPGDGAMSVDLVELLGEEDPEGHEMFLWIEEVPEEDLGGGVHAKEVTVSVRYRASGPDIDRTRRYTVRTLVLAEGGP